MKVRKRFWWLFAFHKSIKWVLLGMIGILAFFTAAGSLMERYLFHLTPLRWEVQLILAIAGVFTAYIGFKRAVKSIIDSVSPFSPVNIYQYLQTDLKIRHGPKIVVIGGGTGLSVLLRGLKKYTSNLTAIVTVTDDGGSSGRLRDELGILPPGDIRNCLVALAETENTMDQVFQHRFQNSGSLSGHSLGNLLLTALTEITGDFYTAIQEVSKVLAVRGRVLPATLESVVLCARMAGGDLIKGESSITGANQVIDRIFLEPPDCQPLPEAVQAIMEADAVVLGPGSLYTSLIPNLLVHQIGQAFRETTAPRIFIANIMTEPGETTGFTASDHLNAVIQHIGPGSLDYAIVNNTAIDDERLARYQAEGAGPVIPDAMAIRRAGVQPVFENLLGSREVAWHDPERLAATIIRVILRHKGVNVEL
ncbi:MAG: gluconeogenesis factor YvcK family protein [Solirubrobacterales bacterium]